MGCWFNSRLNGTVGLLAVPGNPGQPETGSMDSSSFLPTKCADSLSPNICETSNLYTRVMKCCRRTVMKCLPTRTLWISCSSCKIFNEGGGQMATIQFLLYICRPAPPSFWWLAISRHQSPWPSCGLQNFLIAIGLLSGPDAVDGWEIRRSPVKGWQFIPLFTNMSSQVVRQILCGWSILHQTRYHGCLKSLTSWKGNPSIVQKAFISTSELCFSCTGDALWLDLCHCVSKRLKEKQKAHQSSAPGTRSKAVKSRTSAPNNMGAMSTAQRLNLRKKWVNVCGGKGETYPPLKLTVRWHFYNVEVDFPSQGAKLFIPGMVPMVPLLKGFMVVPGGWLNSHYLNYLTIRVATTPFAAQELCTTLMSFKASGSTFGRTQPQSNWDHGTVPVASCSSFIPKKKHIYTSFPRGKRINSLMDVSLEDFNKNHLQHLPSYVSRMASHPPMALSGNMSGSLNPPCPAKAPSWAATS